MSPNNPPAFPGLSAEMTGIDSDGNERWDTEPSGGMSLRDYFAAKAIPVATKWEEESPTYDSHDNPTFRGIAERAYLMADAMLKARES